MNPQYLFMGTADTLLRTFRFLADSNNPEYITLHVPDASVESYKATAPWSAFGKIVALTDEETGIENIDANAENSVIYDLSGRRVQNAQKGIYIKNGKKVMVK